MLAIIPSATVLGVEGRPVTVEVHVSSGLPSFTIVGLPDTACREARDRVRAALLCTSLPWPMRRITVNLAPSGLRKVGSGLDLAIAVALLVAQEELEPAAVEGLGFLGELGLDGSLRAVPGMVSLVEALASTTAVVPVAAAGEARLVGHHEVKAVRSLGAVVAALRKVEPWPDPPPPGTAPPPPPDPDLADVRGQPVARLALEVAAAGHHHLLMVGPPGSGKTMLARRLPGLLPRLSQDHALEVTRIHSAAGLPLRAESLIWRPPLRAPHHNASPVSVIGGGTAVMRPGEVSLAHATLRLCSMRTKAQRAAIYCRISDDQEGTGKGVARQQEDCVVHAERIGWTVAGVYTDNDVSAYRGKRRPEYERMLADLRAGTVDGVIAWHPDRLHRQPRELEHFMDVVDAAGAPVSTVLAGDLDLSTADGRMHARITGAVARHESEHKSERIRRKAVELARAGKVSGGGTRPFGYEADRRTLCEPEADLIRAAAAEVLAGGTLWGICNRWNDQGVATVTGTSWKPQILRGILTRGRIAGWRAHKGELVAEAEWPAIISRADLERLRARLLDPSRQTNRRSTRYLLTGGIARCGLCHSPLIARGRGGGTRGYTCATQHGGCGKVRVAAEPFEDYVAAKVLEALDGPALWDALAEAEREKGPGESAILDAIAADEASLEELAGDYYVRKVVPKRSFLTAQADLQARIDANRARLATSTGTRALGTLEAHRGDLAARWADLPIDARRAIVATVLPNGVELLTAERGRWTEIGERVAFPEVQAAGSSAG